jgi:hypothetical protein
MGTRAAYSTREGFDLDKYCLIQNYIGGPFPDPLPINLSFIRTIRIVVLGADFKSNPGLIRIVFTSISNNFIKYEFDISPANLDSNGVGIIYIRGAKFSNVNDWSVHYLLFQNAEVDAVYLDAVENVG